MKCPNCGSQVSDGAKFCPTCGKSMSNDNSNFKNEEYINRAKDMVDKGKRTLAHSADRFNKQSSRFKKITAGIVVVVAIMLIYFGVYIPHKITSTLQDNGFTEQNGYTVSVGAFSKKAFIKPSDANIKSYGEQLQGTGYSTDRIAVESQLQSAANDLSSRVSGDTTITLAPNDNTNFAWEYVGTKEEKRFQNTNECIKLHDQYLQEQSDSDADDSAVGGLLIGGFLGALLGGS